MHRLLGRVAPVTPYLPVTVRVGKTRPVARILLRRLLLQGSEGRSARNERAEAVGVMGRRRPPTPAVTEGLLEGLGTVVQATPGSVLAPAAVPSAARDPKGKTAARKRPPAA